VAEISVEAVGLQFWVEGDDSLTTGCMGIWEGGGEGRTVSLSSRAVTIKPHLEILEVVNNPVNSMLSPLALNRRPKILRTKWYHRCPPSVCKSKSNPPKAGHQVYADMQKP
jgi:hypothetical protein